MKQIRFIFLILFLTASFACENKINVKEPDKENNLNRQSSLPKI